MLRAQSQVAGGRGLDLAVVEETPNGVFYASEGALANTQTSADHLKMAQGQVRGSIQRACQDISDCL